MTENAPRWPMMVGTYLEAEGCLGAALVGLLGGDRDFVDGFVMTLETRLTFVLVNVNDLGEGGGGGGGRGAERTGGLKQVFSSDVDT